MPLGAQQGGQQVALGEAVAGAVPQHVGSLAGDGVLAVIPAVQNLIAHKVEAARGDLRIAGAARRQRRRAGGYFRVAPVYVGAAGEIGRKVCGHGEFSCHCSARRYAPTRADCDDDLNIIHDARNARTHAHGSHRKSAMPGLRCSAKIANLTTCEFARHGTAISLPNVRNAPLFSMGVVYGSFSCL